MNSFLYFVEGDQRPGAREYIADRLESAAQLRVKFRGNVGTLYAHSLITGNRHRIDETQQDWLPVHGHDGVWVGVWRDSKPTAQELKRKIGLAGPLVEFANGEKWVLPQLLYNTENGVDHSFPRTLRPEGEKWISRIKSEYVDLFHSTIEVYERIIETLSAVEERRAPNAQISIREVSDFVASGLAVNYRVGREEIGLLDIFLESMLLQYAGIMVGQNMIKQVIAIAEGRQGLGKPAPASASVTGGSVE